MTVAAKVAAVATTKAAVMGVAKAAAVVTTKAAAMAAVKVVASPAVAATWTTKFRSKPKSTVNDKGPRVSRAFSISTDRVLTKRQRVTQNAQHLIRRNIRTYKCVTNAPRKNEPKLTINNLFILPHKGKKGFGIGQVAIDV